MKNMVLNTALYFSPKEQDIENMKIQSINPYNASQEFQGVISFKFETISRTALKINKNLAVKSF